MFMQQNEDLWVWTDVIHPKRETRLFKLVTTLSCQVWRTKSVKILEVAGEELGRAWRELGMDLAVMIKKEEERT